MLRTSGLIAITASLLSCSLFSSGQLKDGEKAGIDRPRDGRIKEPKPDKKRRKKVARKRGGATPAKKITLLPGFHAELVYTVPKKSQGSWVAITKAPRGTLIVSDQSGSLYRVNPDKGNAEKIDLPIGKAQGLLWAFDSLYAHVNGKEGGLFRARDTDGDGRLDTSEKLMDVRGAGEHGQHAIILSADKKSLFVAAGNHTLLPKTSGSRMPSNWGEDLLLPRQWDARGHARGRLAPGGWVCKVDPDGKNWEVYCTGFRNQYDIAINRHGDMFTWDADMEWDMGMPWYRPTRVCQVVSGGEFGWRSGTGKWPAYYEDSLPPTLNMGPGSPTGVLFGTGAKFPTKYQDALFILDWTFGTIWAVHLTPRGAGYTATKEEFLSGVPLPVTDAVIGGDGAFYFTIGGRGTQSALYRVTYRGGASTAPPTKFDPDAASARHRRRRLESYHGRKNPAAIEAAWPHLDSRDRFLRFAARIAVESQPVDQWREKALREDRPRAKVTALVAFARMGGKDAQGDLLDALLALPPNAPRLAMLRAYALSFIRMGRPDEATADKIITKLDRLLPSDSDAVNTELVRLLVYLDAPGVVGKTLPLLSRAKPTPIPDWATLIRRNARYGGTIRRMLDNHPPLQKLQYAFLLRNQRNDWTMEERKAYFTFINNVAKHPGGASYAGFLQNMRKDALQNCSSAERRELASITGEQLITLPTFEVTPPKGPGREWTVKAALAEVGDGLRGRNFKNGRSVFYALSCAKCHRFDGAGGAIGPDLSTVGNKFSLADLLEAILEPSKVISDEYGMVTVIPKKGDRARGLVVEKQDGTIEVYTSDPYVPPVRFKKSNVKSVKPSRISQMPTGLADALNRNELLDLLAYLLSQGDAENRVFSKSE